MIAELEWGFAGRAEVPWFTLVHSAYICRTFWVSTHNAKDIEMWVKAVELQGSEAKLMLEFDLCTETPESFQIFF